MKALLSTILIFAATVSVRGAEKIKTGFTDTEILQIITAITKTIPLGETVNEKEYWAKVGLDLNRIIDLHHSGIMNVVIYTGRLSPKYAISWMKGSSSSADMYGVKIVDIKTERIIAESSASAK
ncbi:MAG TPA: hypothetical protein VKX17_04500 [Planctomycetota bacterium]|nr:hypothetical protein [Planctomycetota bacterium]